MQLIRLRIFGSEASAASVEPVRAPVCKTDSACPSCVANHMGDHGLSCPAGGRKTASTSRFRMVSANNEIRRSQGGQPEFTDLAKP